jgi:hypothetical protein
VYRVIDIGNIRQPPELSGSLLPEGYLRLSDRGAIAGSHVAFIQGVGDVRHGFAWWPQSYYGAGTDRYCGQMHDLNALSGFSNTERTVSHGISETGILVGQRGADLTGDGHYWKLDAATPIPNATLGTFSGGAYSVGYDISDHPSPVVVGKADAFNSSCDGRSPAPFRAVLPANIGDPVTLVELPPPTITCSARRLQ